MQIASIDFRDLYKVPVGVSLGVIALILAVSVVASLAFPKEVLAHDPVEHDPLAPAPEDASSELGPNAEVTPAGDAKRAA